jgi:hypothetical protein
MSAGPGGSYGSESFRTWEWDPSPFRKDGALGAKVKSPQGLIFCRNRGVETQLQIVHAASAPLYDDKEEKPHGACKEDHFQRETGDAETAIGGISP